MNFGKRMVENFIPYSQSRADFMKVVSWNNTPTRALLIYEFYCEGSSWTLWCFVALKIWVLSNKVMIHRGSSLELYKSTNHTLIRSMCRTRPGWGHLEAACDDAPMREIGEFEKTWHTSILACIHRYVWLFDKSCIRTYLYICLHIIIYIHKYIYRCIPYCRIMWDCCSPRANEVANTSLVCWIE